MKTEKKTKAFGIRRFLLNLGKIVTDLAKLCFGSLVLGTVIRGEIPSQVLLTIGIIASAAGALGGILLVTLFEEK